MGDMADYYLDQEDFDAFDIPVRGARFRKPPPYQHATAPLCNRDHGTMVRRRNSHTGEYFWGCPRFPNCTRTKASTQPKELPNAK